MVNTIKEVIEIVVGIFQCTICGHLISKHSPVGGMFYCAVCRKETQMDKVG